MKILTLFPEIWSERIMSKEFGASRAIASKANKPFSEKGILSDTNPRKAGNKLSDEDENNVREFYKSDEISCSIPGKKDTKVL